MEKKKQLAKQDKSITIKQHNAITEARYEMTSLQKNMFYLLIRQLKDDDPEQTKYKLPIKELRRIKGVKKGLTKYTRLNKEEILQAAKGLISSGFTLYDEIQKGFITIGILHSADYGEGIERENLLVDFDAQLYPFLYNVKSKFTVFSLQDALNLKSKYSKRIYEMLCQFKSTGIFRISVKEIKERFELLDSKTGKEQYTEFGLFAKNVLKVAQNEINEKTDINFTYEATKVGRKITNLEFKISSKEVVKGLAESTPVDSALAKLKESLVTQFKLSKTLAKKVIENIPIEKIEAKNNKTWKDYETGKIDDLGAYCTTLFQNWLDGAEPMLEKPNFPKHIGLKPVQQRPQDSDLEKENLTRLCEFGLEQKRVYTGSSCKLVS
jgi:plasmid replication initiation protein